MMPNNLLEPSWPAPDTITAFTTLKNYGHLNKDRALFKQTLNLPSDPIWLKQVHGRTAVKALPENKDCEADASFTDETNRICLVSTADCLPLLICNREGTEVAAVHAGWRGLLSGVIESTLDSLKSPRERLLVWLGPGISQKNYEVGEEVRHHFLEMDSEIDYTFLPSPNQRWFVDLYAIARFRLKKQGVNQIYGGEWCTFSDPDNFFSYRRDRAYMGQMSSLIWINN